jgi:hypothetical protein
VSTAVHPTHAVEVEGVGRFVFRKRRYPDQIRIEARADRFTDGPTDNRRLEDVALAYATLEVLLAEGPEGFDLAALDPLDLEDSGVMWKVWGALRDAEATFRKGAGA